LSGFGQSFYLPLLSGRSQSSGNVSATAAPLGDDIFQRKRGQGVNSVSEGLVYTTVRCPACDHELTIASTGIPRETKVNCPACGRDLGRWRELEANGPSSQPASSVFPGLKSR
jgi:ribosomal protein S27E